MADTSKVAVIDGDSIIYILSWQFREQQPHGDDYDLMLGAVDQFVLSILQAVKTPDYVGALGHKQFKSFRETIYKMAPYKGNRKDKPEFVTLWEPVIRERLIDTHGFTTYPYLEADDIVSLVCHQLRHINITPVVCSPDKDLRQIPGEFYDYKKTEFGTITEAEADYFLWMQILTGDSTDNIAGVPGVGEVKAKEKFAKSEHLFHEETVRKEYNKYFGNHYGPIIFTETRATVELLTPKHQEYNNLIKEEFKFDVQRNTSISTEAQDIFGLED